MDFEAVSFWKNVNNLIKKQGTKQEVVAEKCNISYQTFRGWVSRKTFPGADEALKIANILETTVSYLITGKNIGEYSQEILTIAQKIAALSPEDRQDIIDFIEIKLKRGKRKEKTIDTITIKESESAYSVDLTSIPVREEVIDSVIFHDWGVIEIPLLGTTAAGQPINFEDIEADQPTRPWAASLIQGDPKNYYCVTVRGDSMTEADIKDGDYALIKHTRNPQSGEIMLVRHDNSSTLKRIKITEGKNGRKEIYICWEDGSKHKEKLDKEGYEIQGILVAIGRKPRKRADTSKKVI